MSEEKDYLNRGGLYAFIFSFGFSILFCIYLAVFHRGIDLKEIPEHVAEVSLKGASGDGAKGVAFNSDDVDKPWMSSDEMVNHGKKVYKTNCAICHGKKGGGDGVAGKSLVPPPRNLVLGNWKQGGDSVSLYKTIQNGIPGGSMAAFTHIPKNNRWALVHFIRSITKNKVSDNAKKLEAFAKTAE